MSDVFELTTQNSEAVVLKVKELSNLDIALNPYVNSSYDYITVSRGEDHVLTIIHKDGKTTSFQWGRSTTLIGKELETLKEKVIYFIEEECGIPLGWTGSNISSAEICYNDYHRKWEAILRCSGKDVFWFSKSANSKNDMVKIVNKFLPNLKWEEKVSRRGGCYWEAAVS